MTFMQDTQESEGNQVQSEVSQVSGGSTAQSERQYTAQDFVDKYNALVAETGFRISFAPTWIARDDGTWSMQIQTSVAQAPKQVQE